MRGKLGIGFSAPSRFPSFMSLMAWNDLTPDEVLHYAGEEEYLEKVLPSFPEATSISGIYLRPARAHVLRDLGYAFGINPSDPRTMTVIDDLVDDARGDNRADDLRRAIAYKQLELIFTRFPGAEGELNETKRKSYARLYAGLVQGFPGLATTKGRGIVMAIPIRR